MQDIRDKKKHILSDTFTTYEFVIGVRDGS